MKRILEGLILQPIRVYASRILQYPDIQLRLRNLEIAADVCIRNRTYVASDDVGFNGQSIRKKIFEALLSIIRFEAMVETGTEIGNTTGYMAEKAKLPIYTVESNPLFHSIAKMRLSSFAGIHFELSDSREFIKKLAVSHLSNQCVFFYLDAHGYNELPLKEEIDLIARNWEKFVIMVDDFQVPNDRGYIYGNYGRNRVLCIEYIRGSLSQYHLIPFFPSMPSEKETGHKRGCVVITRQGEFAERIAKLSSLVKAQGYEHLATPDFNPVLPNRR
jgi:hypothetical protein